MRAKKPAMGRQPHVEEEDNEELVWARLRERAAPEGATSEVVARPVHDVNDPYSGYDDYGQQEDGQRGTSQLTDESSDEDEDPDLWERLRAQAQQPAERTSDVAPLGAHTHWDAQQSHHDADAQYYAQQQQEAQQYAEYAEQQRQAEYYAQQQQQAEHYAQQEGQAEYYAQQRQAEYYAQQQQAEYYAQQQQAEYYAQQQQAGYYAQQQQQQQAQYEASLAFAAQNAPESPSPFHAAYAPAAVSHAPQASWQQLETLSRSHDSFEPKRGGGLKWVALLVVAGAAGGATYAYPRLLQTQPTQIAPASMAALPAAASAPAPLGVEEARARDALFGTHTAPPAAPAPTPSVTAVPPSEPAVADAPPEEAKSVPEAAPRPARKESALRGPSGKKAKKAGKAKKKAKLAAVARRKAAKPKRPRPAGGGLSGGESSNDPLMGI